jgi:hypothetical protein
MLKCTILTLLVATTVSLFVSSSMAATRVCYTSRPICFNPHRSRGPIIQHSLHHRHIALRSRDRSTNYYTYSEAPKPDRGLAYGPSVAPQSDGGHFAYGPAYPTSPYPNSANVAGAPIYNFYGPTNNFFGPIYNYGQIGNVRSERGPASNDRINPWHGYDPNDGLENGY